MLSTMSLCWFLYFVTIWNRMILDDMQDGQAVQSTGGQSSKEDNLETDTIKVRKTIMHIHFA